MVYERVPKGPFTLPGDLQNPKKWSLCSGHMGLQRILMKDELKKCQVGQVQGDKGLSLTGFRSCTTDSMDINGRGGGQAGQRMGKKR